LLARYILSSRLVRGARVKAEAFLPASNGELSVFVIDGLSETTVWAIGRQHVAEPQGRTLHARADVPAVRAIENELSINMTDEPPRHADVINWPTDKSAQKLRAQVLAESATLHHAPALAA
jgi:hypothetical protein